MVYHRILNVVPCAIQYDLVIKPVLFCNPSKYPVKLMHYESIINNKYNYIIIK